MEKSILKGHPRLSIIIQPWDVQYNSCLSFSETKAIALTISYQLLSACEHCNILLVEVGESVSLLFGTFCTCTASHSWSLSKKPNEPQNISLLAYRSSPRAGLSLHPFLLMCDIWFYKSVLFAKNSSIPRPPAQCLMLRVELWDVVWKVFGRMQLFLLFQAAVLFLI